MRTFLTFTILVFITLMPFKVNGVVLDRVVAVIDTYAITLSELEEQYTTARTYFPDITREEVLESMVNRHLLVRKAKEIRLEAATEQQLIDDYIEFKVRAFIRIDEEDINTYYQQHYQELKDVPVKKVKKDIERLLTEQELNRKLQEHIEQLRKDAYIKIFLD